MKGKVVGETNAQQYAANGLKDKKIKDVVIPRKYEGTNIVEIGRYAFFGTGINSILISRTIIHILCGAFEECQQLTKVRFEAGSVLNELEHYVFYNSKSIKKIDFPAPLSKIREYDLHGASLECFSYSGLTFINSESSFFSENPLIIHVPKNYPQTTFAGRAVSKDDLTCGVSNFNAYKCQCTKCIGRSTRHCLNYMLMLIYS